MKVTSSETVANCPSDFIFTVRNRDGSAFDASLFSWDGATQTFTTSSSDINLFANSPYQLTADVAYLGYSIAGSLDFDVNLEITCDLSSLDALTINPMTFTIFESSDV